MQEIKQILKTPSRANQILDNLADKEQKIKELESLLKAFQTKIKQLEKSQIKYCQYGQPNCQKIASYQHFLQLGWKKLDKGYICSNCKEFLEKPKKPIFIELTKIEGILTSNLRTRTSSEVPYMAFFRDDNSKKHSLAECEASKCQECEIPVIFRIKGALGEWLEPILKKGDSVVLEGKFSASKESNRPSFTCYSYQVLKDHE